MPETIVKNLAQAIAKSYGELNKPSDAHIENLVHKYLTGPIVYEQCLDYVIENQNVFKLESAQQIQQAS